VRHRLGCGRTGRNAGGHRDDLHAVRRHCPAFRRRRSCQFCTSLSWARAIVKKVLPPHELRTYIEKTSGAKPSGNVPVSVFVGRSPHTDKLKLAADGLKYGAYRVAYILLVIRSNSGLPEHESVRRLLAVSQGPARLPSSGETAPRPLPR